MAALLPSLAIALALGIALCEVALLPSSPGVWTLAVGALCLGWAVRRRPRFAAGCAVLAALLAGTALHAHRRVAALERRPDRAFEAVVEAPICARRSDARWLWLDLCDARRVDGEREATPLPSRIRLLLEREEHEDRALAALRPGDRIRAATRITPPAGRRNPGGRSRESTLTREGVGATARLRDPSLWVRVGPPPTRGPLARLAERRERMAQRLHGEGPGGSLLAALALGDRAGLPPAARESFARLGIAHLLAISGLHVALVAAGAFAVARAGLVRIPGLGERIDTRRTAVAWAWCVAGLYALLAGWGVPARRAFLLLSALVAGVAAGRGAGGFQPLALAAILILTGAPHALFELGAQLSFLATAALIAATRIDEPGGTGAARGLRPFARVFDTTAVAVAATSPVLAWHGLAGGGGLGLIANLIAIPWSAFVLLPCSLAAAAAAALPEVALLRPAISLAAGVGQLSLAVVAAVASALPPQAPARPPHLASGLLALGLALAVVRARGRVRRTGLLLLQIALLRLAPAAPVAPGPPRIVSLDVGLGDATLIQSGDAAVLVDAGRAREGRFDLGRSAVVPALAALGVRRLDLLVVSHADLDHRGGVPAVLEALAVEEVWLPPGGLAEPSLERVRRAAARRGALARERSAGDFARLPGLRIDVLAPPAVGPGSSNERSLVLRATLAGRRVLLPGDIGEETERKLVSSGTDLAADLLKLAHHGSGGSSGADFLGVVSPELALLSAPCAPGRPLPSGAVLGRVRAASIPLAWTGRDGAVIVGLGQPMLRVRRWGAPRRCELPVDPAVLGQQAPRGAGLLGFLAPGADDALGPRSRHGGARW